MTDGGGLCVMYVSDAKNNQQVFLLSTKRKLYSLSREGQITLVTEVTCVLRSLVTGDNISSSSSEHG